MALFILSTLLLLLGSSTSFTPASPYIRTIPQLHHSSNSDNKETMSRRDVQPNTATDLLLDGEDANARLERKGTRKLTVRRRRLDVINNGTCPVVFTAPHTLELSRDGDINHVPEMYTGSLARNFAEITGGSCITWSEAEVQRVRRLGRECKSNRDPNYLLNRELERSPWFAALRSCRERLCPLWSYSVNDMDVDNDYDSDNGQERCDDNDESVCLGAPLHVDVHGIRDPPVHKADCLVGSDAMRKHLGNKATDTMLTHIENQLLPVLNQISLEDEPESIILLNAGAPGGTPRPDLGGCWGGSRNTLTQMSTNRQLFAKCGSMHYPLAIQVELSLRLRKHLDKNEVDRKAFALALVSLVQ